MAVSPRRPGRARGRVGGGVPVRAHRPRARGPPHAAEAPRGRGRRRAAGDDLRWLSRILWWSGQGMEAAAVGDMAIATLEAFPDSRELAMALSGRSQLAMLAWERERAIELGTRAIALARRIDDQETVTHALTNVGTALLGGAEHDAGRRAARGGVHARARDRLRRSRGTRADQPRCRHAGEDRAGTTAALERALAFARERELEATCSTRSACAPTCGCCAANGDAAEADARALAGSRRAARRQPVSGADGARPPAGAPRRRPRPARRSTTRGSSRSRARSCSGSARPRRRAPSTRGSTATWPAPPPRRARPTSWRSTAASRGRAPSSRSGCGARASRSTARPDDPEPYALALAGDWGGAAAAFGELGFPYDRADVLIGGRRRGGAAGGAGDPRPARRRAVRARTCGGGCAPTACAGSRAARGRPRGPGWPG